MSALTDVQAAVTSLNSAEAELSTPPTPSVGDAVLAAVITTLTSASYTITPPTEAAPAEAELPAGESDDSATV